MGEQMKGDYCMKCHTYFDDDEPCECTKADEEYHRRKDEQ